MIDPALLWLMPAYCAFMAWAAWVTVEVRHLGRRIDAVRDDLRKPADADWYGEIAGERKGVDLWN